MPPTAQELGKANSAIVQGTKDQIADLQPALAKVAERANISASLERLEKLATTASASAAFVAKIKAVGTKVLAIKALSDFGEALGDLYSLQLDLDVEALQAGDAERIGGRLLGLIASVQQLLSYRPDVGAVMADLAAMKNLRGGPADAVSFHDFNVLQMAFKSIWLHAFDYNLQSAAAELYEKTVRQFDELGLPTADLQAVLEVNDLNKLTKTIESLPVPPIPANVGNAFSTLVTTAIWAQLGDSQRTFLIDQAEIVVDMWNGVRTFDLALLQDLYARVEHVVRNPDSTRSRLAQLVLDIGKYMSEPYAFDVFAPGSYNFGLVVTYRQRWEPGTYQAGDLVATIPLAPGEVRRFSKKRVVKTSRAQKEIEKAMSAGSVQRTEASRAEAEIIQKVANTTNFKLSSHGSFSMGIGSFDTTHELTENQSQLSSSTKKSFHEATIKAAEEYRRERSMEVESSTSVEMEETSSGELSNPNNEITVTYLFYELQRRFKIREYLHRVRPVIMIAQDVPSPNEIDEAWLVQYQWIIARVLLDDSFRPALTYLTSGFAGDEVAIEVTKAHWEKQRQLVDSLEQQVKAQLSTRNTMRESLVKATLEKDLVPEMPGALKVFTFGVDPSESAKQALEAFQRAGETRLQYVEQALADAQDKLSRASTAFEEATRAYTAGLQNQFTRHIAIDQLRVHVKQNILYYMQAIWSTEFEDQRFFRLYKQKVICPSVDKSVTVPFDAVSAMQTSVAGSYQDVELEDIWATGVGGAVGGKEHELIEMADLDNPLGYKGNYIVFPLKDSCQLTTFMLTTFIDNHLGVNDPDGSSSFDAETFDERWNTPNADRVALRKELDDHIAEIRRSTDEIIIPTGQLFIEALPGTHPLLEDFKLAHRFEDVRKVRAEVRHAELENLRLASRLVAGQSDTALLEDPDIEKKVVVNGSASTIVGPGP